MTRRAAVATIAWLLIGVEPAHAGGVYNRGQSVAALGSAFAGSTVLTDDVSTVFFNAAGLTTLERGQLSLNANLFVQDFRITNRGSALSDGTPITGDEGGNPFNPVVVPALYAGYPVLSKQLAVGLGVTAPFGLAEEYKQNWFGRHDSFEADLRTINVTPAVAWAPTSWLSIGAGLDIQRSKVSLSNAVFVAPGVDAQVRVQAKGYDIGWNAGILITPWSGTRVGASYRSGIGRDLRGFLQTSVTGGVTQTVEPVHINVDTPDIVTIGIAQRLTERLTALVGFEWTGWSTFEDVRIRRPNAPDAVVEHHWRNTFALSAGGEYKITDSWSLRAGFLYDRTPTVDAFRGTAVPEADRYGLAIGTSYDVTPSWTVDASVAQFYMDPASVDVRRPTLNPAVPFVNIKAEAEWSITVLSVGVRYRF